MNGLACERCENSQDFHQKVTQNKLHIPWIQSILVGKKPKNNGAQIMIRSLCKLGYA